MGGGIYKVDNLDNKVELRLITLITKDGVLSDGQTENMAFDDILTASFKWNLFNEFN